jgi:hypothetical protein
MKLETFCEMEIFASDEGKKLVFPKLLETNEFQKIAMVEANCLPLLAFFVLGDFFKIESKIKFVF